MSERLALSLSGKGGVHSRAAFALAAIALAGCTPGSPYLRPPVAVPSSYRGAQVTRVDLASAFPDWQAVYADPELRGLIQAALAHNFDVDIAAARVAEARALAGVSRLRELPQIDVAADTARLRVSEIGTTVLLPGTDPTLNVFETDLTVSYEVDLWGRLRQLSAAARVDLLASEFARRAVIVGLISDVATAYYNLRALDASRAIIDRTTANRERSLSLTRALFEHGAGTRIDLSRAEANVDAARVALPEILRQSELAENQLRVLLGDNPAPIDRTRIELNQLPVPAEVPSGLPSKLLERRPDILQAEAALIASHARWRAARAALLPTIELTGAVGTQSIPLEELFTQPTQTWSIGLGLIQPLLSAARNERLVDAAAARERAAALEYQKSVQQAFREVSDALSSHTRQLELEDALAHQEEALESVQSQAERRFTVGSATYFEVVDADRDLLSVQLAEVQARRNILLALVQLYRALGGGWSPSNTGSAP